MSFFKNSVYILATLCFFNMLQSAYVYKKLVQIEQKQYKLEIKAAIPEELKELDRAIDSKTAKILMKLLPELEELINRSMSNKGGAPKDDMGALGGMMG